MIEVISMIEVIFMIEAAWLPFPCFFLPHAGD